jgi:hypothetical protein
LILISSLLAWDKTPKNLQEIVHPVEARRRAAEAAEAENKTRQQDAKQKSPRGDDEDEDDAPQSDMEAEMSDKDPELNSNGDPIEAQEEPVAVQQPAKRIKSKFLHHPFTEADYLKRQASKEMRKIKEIEDEVLNLKREGVKTFVISAGVLYG